LFGLPARQADSTAAPLVDASINRLAASPEADPLDPVLSEYAAALAVLDKKECYVITFPAGTRAKVPLPITYTRTTFGAWLRLAANRVDNSQPPAKEATALNAVPMEL
jgi:hypothetical protein